MLPIDGARAHNSPWSPILVASETSNLQGSYPILYLINPAGQIFFASFIKFQSEDRCPYRTTVATSWPLAEATIRYYLTLNRNSQSVARRRAQRRQAARASASCLRQLGQKGPARRRHPCPARTGNHGRWVLGLSIMWSLVLNRWSDPTLMSAWRKNKLWVIKLTKSYSCCSFLWSRW